MLSEAAASILSILPFAAAEPAGGAAATQVAIATAGAALGSTALLGLAMGHRSGRVQILGRIAAVAERASGLPGWAALPAGLAAVALNVALLGMYWDISLHIDNGRDAGPLANPAHYLILAGLFGVFTAGVLAIVLPKERPGPGAVRIARGWYAPAGGVLLTACGAFSLIAFPLDDVWHRLFGQDVTLWGPTHLMLIGGAGLSLVAQAVLLAEGLRARARTARPASRPAGRFQLRPAHVTAARRLGLMGGLLVGLSTFQAEFDFGVPQYRLVFQPHADRPRGRRRARRGPAVGRPGRSDRRRPLLPRPARRGQPPGRPGVRPDHAQPPAVSRRGALRGAPGARARPPAAAVRCGQRRGDRDRRPRVGVGLVAVRDAAAVDRRPAPRGDRLRGRRGSRRRHRRRAAGARAARRAAATGRGAHRDRARNRPGRRDRGGRPGDQGAAAAPA